MLVSNLWEACSDWVGYTSISIFDRDTGKWFTFTGTECLEIYGSYKVYEFSVCSPYDKITIYVGK